MLLKYCFNYNIITKKNIKMFSIQTTNKVSFLKKHENYNAKETFKIKEDNNVVTLNGLTYTITYEKTVLELCLRENIYIPRFCYSRDLSIEGNCRVCLVELVGFPKPISSCTYPIMNNMKILTNSPRVLKAREGVFEFILLNHPLDCPICDQGGECDLQDQALVFGSDRTRSYWTLKSSVSDKFLGTFVKTVMTRCIQCTKCVRFLKDVTKTRELGSFLRGGKMEIGTYKNKIIESRFSGNLIDICPVGALTSKHYAFKARPWELKKITAKNVLNSHGENLYLYYKSNKLVKILPNRSSFLGWDWIEDKTRFIYDGLRIQRIIKPFFQYPSDKNKKVVYFNDSNVLVKYLFNKLPANSELSLFFDNQLDLKTLIYLKTLYSNVAIKNINTLTSQSSMNDFGVNLMTSKHQKYDFVLLIDLNLDIELPILNLLLARSSDLKSIYNIGFSPKGKSNIGTTLGIGFNVLYKFLEGKHFLSEKFIKAKNPLVLYGNSFLNREEGKKLLQFSQSKHITFLNINSFNYLPVTSNDVGMLNIGYPVSTGSRDLFNFKNDALKVYYFIDIFNLNKYKKNWFYNFVNSINPYFSTKAKNLFLIFQGTHYYKFLNNFNLILPTLSILEYKGIYYNYKGYLYTNNSNKELQQNVSRLTWFYLSLLSPCFNKTLKVKKSNLKVFKTAKYFTNKISKEPKGLKSLGFFFYTKEGRSFIDNYYYTIGTSYFSAPLQKANYLEKLNNDNKLF